MEITKNTNTATCYGNTATIQIGSAILLDSGRCELLLDGSDWDRCDFRFPNPILAWAEKHAIAIKVEVTGRTIQRVQGEDAIRVRIEWIQDDEPSTFTSGYWFPQFSGDRAGK